MDSLPPTATALSLEDLRRRRAELRDSMGALEQALASPASGRAAAWVERVHVALLELAGDLRQHVDITESADGLHASLVSAAPRLAGPVARLTRDHVRLTRTVDDLIELCDRPDAADQVTEVRVVGTALLSDLARHRQRGSDLVWEAYEVDIGGTE
jgi:hypothetical protein